MFVLVLLTSAKPSNKRQTPSNSRSVMASATLERGARSEDMDTIGRRMWVEWILRVTLVEEQRRGEEREERVKERRGRNGTCT